MVLRNVAKTFSLEEQRQEINEIAVDLNAVNTTLANWNAGDWDTAYSWGDHAQAGYLTSYTETDPVFGASAASGIAAGDITNWNSAYGWGDHGSVGYWVENSVKISNWDTAHGWGDHSTEGYLTTVALNDISDVNLSTAPTDGQALIWDNANSYWKAASAISPTGSYTVSGLTANSSISLRSGLTTFNYITINTPSSITTGYSLTLPPNDGNNGQVLSTNGSGSLSWVDRGTGDGDLVNGSLPATLYRSNGALTIVAGGSQTTRANITLPNSGDLYIYGNSGTPSNIVLSPRSTGSVQLQHGTATKLQTSSTGISVTGAVSSTTLSSGSLSISGQTNSAVTGVTVSSTDFDHYQEGTWTPIPYYQNAGDQSAASFTTAEGYYTRIGNIVHVSGYVVCSGPSSPANDNVGINSFPYGNALNVPAVGVIMFENNGTSDVNIRMNAGSSLATILSTNGNGNLGDELGTSWSAAFQITYRVF